MQTLLRIMPTELLDIFDLIIRLLCVFKKKNTLKLVIKEEEQHG